MRLFKKAWKTINCSPKMMKVIGEIQENSLRIEKRIERIVKKTDSKCWCSKSGLALNSKHIQLLQESQRGDPVPA